LAGHGNEGSELAAYRDRHVLVTVNRVGVRKWGAQEAPCFHGVEKAGLALHGASNATIDVIDTHGCTLIVHPLGSFGHGGTQINALCWLVGWSGHRWLLKKTKGWTGVDEGVDVANPHG
jgi:hypothetical protein